MDSFFVKFTAHCFRSNLAVLTCATFLVGCGAAASDGDPITGLVGDVGKPVIGLPLPEDPNLQPLDDATPGQVEAPDPEPNPAPAQNDLPFNDPTDLENVGSVVTMADTGLRIGVAGSVTTDSIDMNLIESSWSYMQECLAVVAVAPLVIVTSEEIEPMSSRDDVLRHIDGSVTATATRFSSGVTIQLSVHDLDGTLGSIGFNLRSILGRYLWSSPSLPERDYSRTCASDF